MNLVVVLLATVTGLVTGIAFGFFDVPIPAPPNLAGIMGIIGIVFGYRLVEHFDLGVDLLALLNV